MTGKMNKSEIRKKNKSARTSKNQQATTSSISRPTENLDKTENSEMAKLIKVNKGLKVANRELADENRQLKIKLGKYVASEKMYINRINALTVELGISTHKRSQSIEDIKQLHAKYVGLSKDFVEIIINGNKPVSYMNNNTLIENTNDGSTKKSLNKSNGQQTRMVKPMISGHTIQKPVINLPRVSAEQLERLGQARHEIPGENETDLEEEVEAEGDHVNGIGDVNEDDDNTDVVNGLQLSLVPDEDVDEGDDNDDISLAVEESDDNNETEPQVSNGNQNLPLSTIAELTESAISSHTLINEDTRLNHVDGPTSSRVLIRQRALANDDNPFVPKTCLARTPVKSIRSNADTPSGSSAFDDTFSDISNTISNGHITLRRGLARKRSNRPHVDEEESTATEEGEEEVQSNTIISNSVFLTGLETTQSTITSTPTVTAVTKRKRTRKAAESRHEEETTATTLINSMKNQSCSVVLERLPTRKKKQTPPISSPATSNSTVKSVSPKCARPSRKAKPTNLKEPKLNKKLRKA